MAECSHSGHGSMRLRTDRSGCRVQPERSTFCNRPRGRTSSAWGFFEWFRHSRPWIRAGWPWPTPGPHIAGYKVPRWYDFVDRMPRLESGKLLKRQLRAPYWEGVASAGAPVAARWRSAPTVVAT